ncbi:amino acid adenylation domain-containing protein [Streptomyces sp. DSM 42041]|uniref:Phenyloxazoline synthase MbtB n=1 Tax=Streptomyces hazeniae TaxID=3075538 RepID=A0ABU2NZW9_9ACTN|nr:amino acid adenylation domain-containing protein [Streptomyces sp. DSM 42041]MDT0382161.1 amino acid adenylation domain-containing protein [Streptomyces sp. DSM 42041]
MTFQDTWNHTQGSSYTSGTPLQPTPLQEAYLVGQSEYFELGNVNAHLYEEFEVTDLDLGNATRSLRTLIDRHDVLRLVARADGRLKVLDRVPTYEIPVIDATAWDSEKVEEELAQTRDRFARQGPPTDCWPLFETLCFRLAGGRYHLFVSASLLLLDVHTEGLLLSEFLQLYRDPHAPLPPCSLTYPDYSDSLQTEAAADEEEAWQYWSERIADLPPAPELPVQQADRREDGSAFIRRRYRMNADQWQKLKDRASAAKLTPTSVLCAAYAQVLAQWSKKPNFTLNVLASRRLPLNEDLPHLAGNFGTTIPLAVECQSNASFTDRARAVQTLMWDAVEYASVSAIDISREAARLRGWNSQSALPVVFASGLDMDTTELDNPPFPVREVSGALQTPQVHLDHQVYEFNGALVCNWDAVEGLFPDGLLDEALDTYHHLLNRLANEEAAWEEPAESLLPAPQARDLQPVPTDSCQGLLHTQFLEQAAHHPDRVAVAAKGRRISYGELARWSAVIAERLRAAGAGPGSLVPVVMDKGWEQVAAVMGVVRSGAGYLPVDAALPATRIEYLLGQAEGGIALTQPWVDEQLSWPPGTKRLIVDEHLEKSTPGDWLAPGPATPQSLAYVIYTSGSTGLPKGVAIEHAAAANTIDDVNTRFAVTAADKVLALSSLSFDLSVYDVFGLLAAGGTIVLPSADRMRDPGHWLQLLRDEHVTVWNSVPALMDMLTKYAATAPSAASDLRLVMMSGDWIPVTLPDRIRAEFDVQDVISLGGATEASIWSILYPIGHVDPDWRSIPYGAAMENQRVYVLDDSLEPRRTWAVGELFIGGVGVALGYWRDTARTEQRFITHPRTGARLYRTGDLGRYLPSGNIEFLGREDGQVKIQGYRIELGEIESALQRNPAVQDAVTASHKTANGNVLVAYVVPTEPPLNAQQLREDLATQLPSYMVPTRVIPLDRLPLTSNGKVDRGALPDPDLRHESNRPEAVEPRDHVETGLVRIWEDILDTTGVTVADNFFDIGGNSFAAMRVIAAIRRDFDVDLPLSVLFEGATIDSLARVVRQGRTTADEDSQLLVPIQPEGSRLPFYCVHPVGGNVMCYNPLARLTGGDQPFFGLESAGLSAASVAEQNVETIAASYARAVLDHSAGSRFAIGGWSMGGVIAFEMARQLAEAGHPPAHVVLIDTPFPSSGEPTAPRKADLALRFLTDFRSGKQPGDNEAAQLAQCPDAATALDVARLMIRAGGLPADTDEQQVARLFAVLEANTLALAQYTAGPYSGPVRELRASHGVSSDHTAATTPWASVAPQTTVRVFNGDHYSIVREPAVVDVARELSQILDGPGSTDAAH